MSIFDVENLNDLTRYYYMLNLTWQKSYTYINNFFDNAKSVKK